LAAVVVEAAMLLLQPETTAAVAVAAVANKRTAPLCLRFKNPPQSFPRA